MTLDSELPIASVDSPYSYEYNPDNGKLVVFNEYGESLDAGKLFTVNYDLDVSPWYDEGEYALKMKNIEATDNAPDHIELISYDGIVVIDNDYFPAM
jgi:hypothetical protein